MNASNRVYRMSKWGVGALAISIILFVGLVFSRPPIESEMIRVVFGSITVLYFGSLLVLMVCASWCGLNLLRLRRAGLSGPLMAWMAVTWASMVGLFLYLGSFGLAAASILSDPFDAH